MADRTEDLDEVNLVNSPEPASDDCGFPVVGVGASAGGLDAFTQLLKHLPANNGMAFVLIQHLDPTHPSLLSAVMAKATAMPVQEAEDGMALAPNHVYVIPAAADISLRSGRFVLVPRTEESPRPHLPIDAFFRSMAAACGSRAIGVVLSGTASDGTQGLRAIKVENGITLAQDPRSAKFAEMPQSAVNAGVVDSVLTVPLLAQELLRLGSHPYVSSSQAPPPASDTVALGEILQVVRNTIGVDFTEYKGRTFERRLARRMALRRADGPRDYLALLQKTPEEVHALYEDILIHVTSFFRDKGVFEALHAQILPAIIEAKVAGAPIRIWVAGCSTGEEVYSIGITLLDLLDDSSHAVQIFGSDLSEATISRARTGVYSEEALRDVSEEQRKRYFIKADGGYKINKDLRELCVFVRHDLARDPPFSKLDLVSCRNVLIYFDQSLQKRIIPAFHYALNQPGYLLLGHTEGLAGFNGLFSVVDKSNKIFQRTAVPSTLRFAPRFEAPTANQQPPTDDKLVFPRRATDVARHLDRILLARYSPPGALINDKMEILQFRGQTGSFLHPAPGEPKNDLINMARPGLLAALRETLAEVKTTMAPARREGVEVDQDGFIRTCNLVIFPFTGLPDVQEQLYVVLFEETTTPDQANAGAAAAGQRRRAEWLADRRIPKVEHELMATKEYLHSLIEEHGRTNDDLGSANEELLSGNEELQSTNEELETAKEELQSANEELTTVNDELSSRNQEVIQTNSDLLNLFVTVDIPIIILDLDRRIRRFTPKATTILNVLPSDHGRLFDDIKLNIAVTDLDRQIADVIDTETTRESEVQSRQGRWYRLQIRPYRTADNKIDGAILSMVDIDALKKHVNDAQEARTEAEGANHAKDLFLAILGHELRTPLTSLLLKGQMLLDKKPMDAARLKRIGESIERSTRMQMQLVDDLLDVSRIVTGKLKVDLRTVDLCTVVRAAIDEVTLLAERKSIELRADLDDQLGLVAGDANRLQQVTLNLLNNAIKFTPDHGRVTVTLDAANGLARLRVTDTGQGIEASFLPQVFNRFSQEDSSSTRRHGGLGLGLSIVRYLVEQHGGMVQADSPGIDQGSTFSVTLPLMRVPKHGPDSAVTIVSPTVNAPQSAPGDKQKLNQVSVLVVDDDLATRESVAEMPTELGAEVKTAGSATAAMTILGEFKPRILLCDLAMPDEDGFAFIRRLRALGRDRGGNIPALALTAFAGEDDRRRALAAGFQMLMTKPLDSGRLIAAVVELAELADRREARPPGPRPADRNPAP